MAALKAQVEQLGLSNSVRFIGHVKARYGFSKGRLLVVPSRGNSMPYVVIEAGAAGIPMVAARVGGIPEIFGPESQALFAPGAVDAMADAIQAALDDPAAALVRAQNRCASASSCIFPRRRWSRACWPATGTHLPRSPRLRNSSFTSFTKLTVSSDLSAKPDFGGIPPRRAKPYLARNNGTWTTVEPINARAMLDAAASAAATATSGQPAGRTAATAFAGRACGGQPEGRPRLFADRDRRRRPACRFRRC